MFRPGPIDPSTICAGRVNDGNVDLCQSLNFQLGLGTLVFIIRCDIVFFYAMTVPVVLLILALPFRLYITTLLIPAGSYVAAPIVYLASV